MANPTLDPDVAKSPIAALFSKPFDFKTPDKTRNSKAKSSLNMSELTTDSNTADKTQEGEPKTDEEKEKSPDSRGKKRGRKSPEPSSPEKPEATGKKSKKTADNKKPSRSRGDRTTEEEEKSKDSSSGKKNQKAGKGTSSPVKASPTKPVASKKADKVKDLKNKNLSPVVVLTRTDEAQAAAKGTSRVKKTTESKKSPVAENVESPKKGKNTNLGKPQSKEVSTKKSKDLASPKSPSVNQKKKQKSPGKSEEEEEEVPLKTRRTPRARLSQSITVQSPGRNSPRKGDLSLSKGVKNNSGSKESLNESPKKLLRTPKHTDVKSPMRGKKTSCPVAEGISPSPQKKSKLVESSEKIRKGSPDEKAENDSPKKNVNSPITRSGKRPVSGTGNTTASGRDLKKATLVEKSKKTTTSSVSSPSKRTRGGANLSESETDSPRVTRTKLSSPELIASSPTSPESSRRSKRLNTTNNQSVSSPARSTPRLKRADMKENTSPGKESTPGAKKETSRLSKPSISESSKKKATPSPSRPTKARKLASESDGDSQSSPSTLRSSRRSTQSTVSSQESIKKSKGVLSESINLSPRHVTRGSLAEGDSSMKKTRSQKSPTTTASSQSESDVSPARSTRSKKAPAPSVAKLKQSRSTAVRVSAKMTWNEENG